MAGRGGKFRGSSRTRQRAGGKPAQKPVPTIEPVSAPTLTPAPKRIIPFFGPIYGAFSKLSLTAKLATGILTLFGGYAAWVSIQPQIHIELADREFRQQFPRFIVRNSGYLAARNVTWTCDGQANVYVGGIEESERRFKFDKLTDDVAYASIGILNPGTQAVRRCPEIRIPDGANLSPGTVIVPIVEYKNVLWPFKTKKITIYGLEGDEKLDWYWEYQGEPLDRRQIDQLKQEGYDINKLSRL